MHNKVLMPIQATAQFEVGFKTLAHQFGIIKFFYAFSGLSLYSYKYIMIVKYPCLFTFWGADVCVRTGIPAVSSGHTDSPSACTVALMSRNCKAIKSSFTCGYYAIIINASRKQFN